MALNDYELTAFRMFIQQIKFVGADIYCESSPGDIVTIVADKHNPIFYNDSYVTAAQALTELQQAMIDFANEMEFNGMFYYQSVLDVIRKQNISPTSAITSRYTSALTILPTVSMTSRWN